MTKVVIEYHCKKCGNTEARELKETDTLPIRFGKCNVCGSINRKGYVIKATEGKNE